jgi:electron transfer flavoprotein alpha subunit
MIANMKNPHGIWVFAEQRDGALHPVGLELLGKARQLADKINSSVTAVLLGYGIRDMGPRLIAGGADQVLIGDHPELESYRLLVYCHVLTMLIEEYKPDSMLMGATALGTELAPRIAARLRTGLSAHCIDLDVDQNGRLLQKVPGWGGGVVATIVCPDRRPQMATVMPGVMVENYDSTRRGEVVDIPISLPSGDPGPKILETIRSKPEEGMPLEKAEVVVAGGWGVGAGERWVLIEELARLLGGAVGATRPAVDEGWAKESQMIGQSGKTVRPKLYIGIGISGMMAHVAGIDQSEYIVAVNQDPKAPIFEASDLGVVADLKVFLPLLINEIKSRRH